MRKTIGWFLGVALLAAFAVPQAAVAQQSGEKWLHVRVEKTGDDAESVKVNVPLSLAEAVVPAIDAHGLRHGKIQAHHDVDIDLPVLMNAVKNAADGEFVTVEKKGETVRVAKQGGFLLVKNDTSGEKAEQVNVKIPLVVVEALTSGEKDELDLLAAIKALRELGDIELVTVQDGDETVRIWIDSSNTSQ